MIESLITKGTLCVIGGVTKCALVPGSKARANDKEESLLHLFCSLSNFKELALIFFDHVFKIY